MLDEPDEQKRGQCIWKPALQMQVPESLVWEVELEVAAGDGAMEPAALADVFDQPAELDRIEQRAVQDRRKEGCAPDLKGINRVATE